MWRRLTHNCATLAPTNQTKPKNLGEHRLAQKLARGVQHAAPRRRVAAQRAVQVQRLFVFWKGFLGLWRGLWGWFLRNDARDILISHTGPQRTPTLLRAPSLKQHYLARHDARVEALVLGELVKDPGHDALVRADVRRRDVGPFWFLSFCFVCLFWLLVCVVFWGARNTRRAPSQRNTHANQHQQATHQGPITFLMPCTSLRVSFSSSRGLNCSGSTTTPPLAPPNGTSSIAVFHVLSDARLFLLSC